MEKKYITVPLFENNQKRELITCYYSEFQVNGKDIRQNDCMIRFEMSKEAMIGFASYSLRIVESTDDNYHHHWQVDPLNNPCGNQPLGFFLTSDSPSFVLMYNQILEERPDKDFMLSREGVPSKLGSYYDIPIYMNDSSCEAFELGFENIVRISVFDECGKNVTNRCSSVIMRLSKKGLENLGKSILRLSHITNKQDFIAIPKENESICSQNAGIYTGVNSSSVEFGFARLGNVYEYELNFGSL